MNFQQKKGCQTVSGKSVTQKSLTSEGIGSFNKISSVQTGQFANNSNIFYKNFQQAELFHKNKALLLGQQQRLNNISDIGKESFKQHKTVSFKEKDSCIQSGIESVNQFDESAKENSDFESNILKNDDTDEQLYLKFKESLFVED